MFVILLIGTLISTLANTCVWAALDVGNQAEFVFAHNVARGMENVPPVKWDDNVAAFARKYASVRAEDCLLEHSTDEQYGENLSVAPKGGELSPWEAVQAWVGEKADYDYETNKCKLDKMCGHYTQVVWKNTKSIGCAKVRCTNGGTFINCNYSPPGNFVGEKPF